jgi:hypothetical protein
MRWGVGRLRLNKIEALRLYYQLDVGRLMGDPVPFPRATISACKNIRVTYPMSPHDS